MTLATGTKLSFYEVLGPLGAGAMGEVYRAKDTRLEREVAIKVLPEHFADDPERLKRFEREAKTLASLNHPNVAQIFGVDQIGDVCFLVLELVPGESLEERLKRGALPLYEALDVCRQIAEGLEAAHEAGVIHRDLKPANVRVTPDGKVKVLDFGLAKPAREAGGSQSSTDSVLSTEAGRLLGTPTYMAPEQARGKPIDKRVDIWAFGCVLFESLTAKRAFAGETLTDVFAAVIEREPALTVLPPSIPPRIRELLASCLAKDRKNRLHDIADARLEIERTLAGRDGTSTTADVRRTKRLPSVWLVALSAPILLALGAWLWSALGQPRAHVVTEPTCVSVAMPPDVAVDIVQITNDGRTLIAHGRPKASSGSSQQRFYARRLDRFEFEPLAGTEGALMGFPTRDNRGLRFVAPVSAGATQKQLAFVPLDGSSPATTLAEWQEGWAGWVELASGEILIHDSLTAFRRLPKVGGPVSAPVEMDAGRPGVQRFEFHMQALPDDRAVLVNVVSYGTRGFQYSVGVLDPHNGHVKVVVEDGGNAAYSEAGHLVFARGDVILAAPFDLERVEVLGTPVSVWSGLDASNRAFPGWFRLTDAGTLAYQPNQNDFMRSLSILTETGALEPWSSERRFLSGPMSASPDGRHLLSQMINARGIDELWVSPVDRADFVKLGSEMNVDSFNGVWSPDSRRVAYMRMGRDDRDGVYIQDVDGGKPRRVLASKAGEESSPTAWLPDDSALLLMRFSAGKTSIALLPIGDQETDASRLRPLLPSEFTRGLAALSKDGRLLAFTSNETGTTQTWVTEMRPGGETGRPIRVKTSGSKGHAWSADGKSLFVQDERERLMRVAVGVDPQLSLSEPVEVANLEQLRIGNWAVLPDGKFFVGVKNEGEGEVRRYDMVLDWTEHLKKKLSAVR